MSMRGLHFAKSMVMLAIVSTPSSMAGCGKAAPKAPAPVASVGRPPTDEECMRIGEAIEDAVAEGDGRALDKLIDWNTFGQTVTSGINAPDKFRNDFLRGIRLAKKNCSAFASNMAAVSDKGGMYTLLHPLFDEKGHRLLFRLLDANNGTDYHEYILNRRPDGRIRATDIYIYTSGELLSAGVRRVYAQAATLQSSGLIGRLTGMDRKLSRYANQLSRMNTAVQNENYAEVLNIYKDADPETKKEKGVFLFRLIAAQALENDAEFEQAMVAFRKAFPDDPSLDILTVDYYFRKKQYGEALACIDRLDRAVHGDPVLLVRRADIKVEQGDLAAARADARRALEAEPYLIEAYWSLVAIAVTDKNYDETLQTLREIRGKFETELVDLTTIPFYKDFTESPQFQIWLKENEAIAAEAAKTEPAPSDQIQDKP